MCCVCFFNANTICEHLGYCVVVEYVCVGVCGVSVQGFVSVQCVCGSCVCARVWWWYAFGVVSGCLSVCVHVLFGCVVICSCAVWCWCSWCVCVCLLLCATTLCCVVALNNRHLHTHHEHEHHTAHENTYKPHDSRFQNETDIRWIKGERTPSICIYSTTLMWAVVITGRFALQIQVLFFQGL